MERAIEASTAIRAPLGRAREVLDDDPARLFSDHVGPEQRRSREVPIELVTSVGSGAALEQDVVVRLGPKTSSATAATLPLAWKPSGHESLLPDFVGELVIEVDDDGHTTLVLRGSYHVPFGAVGGFGDALVGRRVARRSIAKLVEQVAWRLDAEVDRRSETVSWRPAPYPVDLREAPDPKSISAE